MNVAIAQNVNYKIIENNPRKINNFSLNVDITQMDFSVGNFVGAGFSYGLWGHAMYKQKLGIDYTLRNGWLTFGKFSDKTLKNRANFQLGGFFIFASRVKSAKTIVILEQKQFTEGSKKYTTTTSINVPNGNKWKYKAARAGLYLNRSIVSMENQIGKDVFSNFYIFGAYGGICFGTTKRLFIQTDTYGEKGNIGHLRLCLDALITPINNAPSGLKNAAPVGARVLVQALPTLKRKDRKRKYRTAMTAEVELGYRMVDGLYFGGSLAFPISRSLLFLRGDNEDQTIKRTTE